MLAQEVLRLTTVRMYLKEIGKCRFLMPTKNSNLQRKCPKATKGKAKLVGPTFCGKYHAKRYVGRACFPLTLFRRPQLMKAVEKFTTERL